MRFYNTKKDFKCLEKKCIEGIQIPWVQPIEMPVLDLEKSANGLIPHRKTGGMQSINLIFKTTRGGRYMFRSIDKDPSKILPLELRGTIVADALQDGISTAYPYAALIVAPLAEAAGILHTNPNEIKHS